MASSPTSAALITRGALLALGALGVADTIDPDVGAHAFAKLNDLIGQWSLQKLTIPSISRMTQAMTSGKGSTSNPYTVGVGGNIDTVRPTDLFGLATYLTSVTPVMEIPRGLLTADQWASIPVKNLTGTLFTSGFYNPTTAGNLGELYLWPVPDNTTYTLVLYLEDDLAEFTSLNADYYVGNGYTAALKYNLALELADDLRCPVTPNLARLAGRTLANVKRQNSSISDMANDFAAIGGAPFGYNIDTGNM